jgi:hypothetical protein
LISFSAGSSVSDRTTDLGFLSYVFYHCANLPQLEANYFKLKTFNIPIPPNSVLYFSTVFGGKKS